MHGSCDCRCLVCVLNEISKRRAYASWSRMRRLIDHSGKTLEEWLNDGLAKAMQVCMIRELKAGVLRSFNMVVYIKTVNYLLGRERRNRNGADREAELRTVDRLASMIIRETYSLFQSYFHSDTRLFWQFKNVFCRLFEAASKKTLMKVASKKFWKFMRLGLVGDCKNTLSLVVPQIVAVLDKMPGQFARRLLEESSILKLNTLIQNQEGVNRALVDKLARLCGRFGFEDIFRRFHPHWKTFSSACIDLADYDDDSGDSCLDSSIRKIACHIKANEIKSHEVLEISLAARLAKFMYSSDRRKANDGNVRRFLSAFLEFDDEGRVENTEAFRNLAIVLLGAATVVQDQLNVSSEGECFLHCTIGCVTRKKKKKLEQILRLLEYLCFLNENWYQWFGAVSGPALVEREAFLRPSFLSSAAARSVSRHMPLHFRWITRLAKICPLAFPFSARHFLFLETRSKVKKSILEPFEVCRDSLVEDLEKMFEGYASLTENPWNFVFKEEMGRGLGPTKEFYSALSLEFQSHKYDLWEGSLECLNDGTPEKCLDEDESKWYITSPRGLFPKLSDSVESQKLFNLLGKTMAKASWDDHLLSIPFNTEFFRKFFSRKHDLDRQSYYDIPKALPVATRLVQQLITVIDRKKAIESQHDLTESEKETMIKNLTFDDGCSFDDLCVNFTVPGYPDITLVSNGGDIFLSPENTELYLGRLNKVILQRLRVKVDNFLNGFSEVAYTDSLSMFTPDELQKIFCGESLQKWTAEELTNCCLVPTEGAISTCVQFLFKVLSSMDETEQRLFLKFVTGRSRLPFGGLKNLNPRLTVEIVKTDLDQTDVRLPSASTCSNLLFLPEYSSVEVTRSKIFYAIREGRDSFELI